MQNAQTIGSLIEIGKIVIPSLITVGVGFWLSRKTEHHKRDLSKELEDYKKDINKELENHKFQLQSSFQTKFYEFQTRYSLHHQRKAETLEKLFELLAKVQMDILVWIDWDGLSRIETKEEFLLKTKEDLQNLIEFFDVKRIYFDEDVKNAVLKIVDASSSVMPRYDQFRFADFVKEINKAHIGEGVHRTMDIIERRFKQLLSAENPNFEIQKSSD